MNILLALVPSFLLYFLAGVEARDSDEHAPIAAMVRAHRGMPLSPQAIADLKRQDGGAEERGTGISQSYVREAKKWLQSLNQPPTLEVPKGKPQSSQSAEFKRLQAGFLGKRFKDSTTEGWQRAYEERQRRERELRELREQLSSSRQNYPIVPVIPPEEVGQDTLSRKGHSSNAQTNGYDKEQQLLLDQRRRLASLRQKQINDERAREEQKKREEERAEASRLAEERERQEFLRQKAEEEEKREFLRQQEEEEKREFLRQKAEEEKRELLRLQAEQERKEQERRVREEAERNRRIEEQERRRQQKEQEARQEFLRQKAEEAEKREFLRQKEEEERRVREEVEQARIAASKRRRLQKSIRQQQEEEKRREKAEQARIVAEELARRQREEEERDERVMMAAEQERRRQQKEQEARQEFLRQKAEEEKLELLRQEEERRFREEAEQNRRVEEQELLRLHKEEATRNAEEEEYARIASEIERRRLQRKEQAKRVLGNASELARLAIRVRPSRGEKKGPTQLQLKREESARLRELEEKKRQLQEANERLEAELLVKEAALEMHTQKTVPPKKVKAPEQQKTLPQKPVIQDHAASVTTALQRGPGGGGGGRVNQPTQQVPENSKGGKGPTRGQTPQSTLETAQRPLDIQELQNADKNTMLDRIKSLDVEDVHLAEALEWVIQTASYRDYFVDIYEGVRKNINNGRLLRARQILSYKNLCELLSDAHGKANLTAAPRNRLPTGGFSFTPEEATHWRGICQACPLQTDAMKRVCASASQK